MAGRRLSRRAFLSGAAAAAVAGCATVTRSAPAFARGPFAGASTHPGLAFVPARLETKALRPRAAGAPAPEHLDPELKILVDVRRRLQRGELTLPPRPSGAGAFTIKSLGPPARAFPALPQAGSAYDASLAVGAGHLLAVGNYGIGVYAKSTGALLLRRDLAAWFPNAPAGVEAFDPRAIYDQHARRYVLLALAKVGPIPPRESYLLLSVSQTDDPLGPWWSWIFDARLAGTTPTPRAWADYPCVGLDAAALYVSVNMYDGPDAPAKLRIFPTGDLYRGAVASYADFVELTNPGVADPLLAAALAVQPCHTYGAPDAQYLANTLTFGTALTLWRVTGAPGAWRLQCDPVSVPEYLYPPEEALQKGEAKPLGIGGSRVRSAVWRDGSVWLSFATAYAGTGGRAFTAARWEEIAGGQRVRGDDVATEGAWYAFPSVMPDRRRRLTMAVSRSSVTEYPSLHYAVWSESGGPALGAVDPGRGPHLKCRQGKPCSDPSARNAWGDYNAAALDPVDETTVWLYGGAGAAGDPASWATWIAAVS